ncbi:MFS transporter [Spirillospora sp. CA-253888]
MSAGRRWRAFTGVAILSFLGCVDLTIVNTAVPAIGREFGAPVARLQLVVGLFIVALSMSMVTMGRLADAHGRRRVLYAGTAVFGAASLGAGCATDVDWLIAFRFVQGAACAVLYTSTSAIVSNVFPEAERGKAIGALYGVNGLGLALGPVLGGLLVDGPGWRWVFWLNVPLILLALAICRGSVPESRGEERGARVDWTGLVLLTAGLPALVLGLTLGDTWGWTAWRTLAALGAGIAALAAFVLVERVAEAPIVQFRLFANRLFISAITADFALAFFYCLAFFLMPLYLESVRGHEGLAVGLMLLPCTALVALLSPVAGRLVDKAGPRPLLCAGFGAFVLSALLQAELDGGSGLVHVAAAFALMGAGWAFVLGPATVAALSAVPERMAGLAVGSSWTFHNLGGALGLALGMAVFRSGGQQAAMWLLAAVSAAALLLIAIAGRPAAAPLSAATPVKERT